MPTAYDLKDSVYDNLTVIRLDGYAGNARLWLCECVCGNRVRVTTGHLVSRHTRSCGCLIGTGRHHVTHGHSVGGVPTITFQSYLSMIQRCYNSNVANYHLYGGRGVIVCEEWLGPTGFQSFLDHAKERPSRIYSLDRYPNRNGNYEPGNVRWATPKEQANNRNTNRYVTYNGEALTVAQWSERTSISIRMILWRLDHDWDIAKALSEPTDRHRPGPVRLITFRGETHNLTEWATLLNLPYSTLVVRLHRPGWDVERAFTTPVKH
jgi:hypothetical protein